jgi:hypothetical protein
MTVPAGIMKEWVETDMVGIESAPGAGVHVLVEKDFRCLHRAGT